jgi:hypothetical protein
MDCNVNSKKNEKKLRTDHIRMNGDNVFVGITENLQEAKKLKRGDIVTVKYSGVNIYDKLMQPTFYRLREDDVNWQTNKQ